MSPTEAAFLPVPRSARHARSAEERDLTGEFETSYRLGAADAMRRVERATCGCDFGSTSWTTRDEADRIAALLALGPADRLLDIGAGAGWPSLYLARTTGSAAVLADLPLTGLRIARARAAVEGLEQSCVMVAAGAEDLPFAARSFDAICHSDVLCCLLGKGDVLVSCRRVIRTGGRMAFTVITYAPEASAADLAALDGAGPPFPRTDMPYPELLHRAGWRIAMTEDWSANYAATIRRLIGALEGETEAVVALLGRADFEDRVAIQRRALRAVENGVLRRHFYLAIPDHSEATPA